MPVQPEYVKKTGDIILKRYPDCVSWNDFEHNKRIVSEVTNISSKRVRNQVAGFITRKKRNQIIDKHTN